VTHSADKEKSLTNLFQTPYASFCTTADRAMTDIKGMKIAFLVWSLDISGGTNVILEHCRFLSKAGAQVTLIRFFRQEISPWHPALSSVRIVDIADLGSTEHFDVAVATWWRTFFELDKVKAGAYAYLVQSIESRFYTRSSPEYSPVVEMTYGFGVPTITISSWIQAYLAFRHRCPSFLVKNGIDKTLFNPIGPVVSGQRSRLKPRVLVEGPLGVDFKQTELALDYLQPYRSEIEIWLLTSTPDAVHRGADRIFSRLSIEQVGHVMRACDVIFKLSLVEGMFGPPLEMFHCGGTAVTTRVTGCEEYMVDGYNCRLIEDSSNPAQVRQVLEGVIRDLPAMAALKAGALETADLWPDWNRSSLEFALSLQTIVNNSGSVFMSSLYRAKRKLEALDSPMVS
jgi:glycosyltransferase involved in cell wall biosynthesis